MQKPLLKFHLFIKTSGFQFQFASARQTSHLIFFRHLLLTLLPLLVYHLFVWLSALLTLLLCYIKKKAPKSSKICGYKLQQHAEGFFRSCSGWLIQSYTIAIAVIQHQYLFWENQRHCQKCWSEFSRVMAHKVLWQANNFSGYNT